MKPTGKTASLTVFPDETILEVKQKFTNKANLGTSKINLLYGAKLLKDNLTINDYGINENATLFAFMTI